MCSGAASRTGRLAARMAAVDAANAKLKVLAFYKEALQVAAARGEPLRSTIITQTRGAIEANATAQPHQIDHLLRQGRRKLKLASSPGFVGIS